MSAGLFLFDRKYVIGKDIALSEIDSILISSNEMRNSYWYDIRKDGQSYFIENGETRKEISSKQYKVLLNHIEGFTYRRKKYNPFEKNIKDRADREVVIYWQNCPEGNYNLDIDSAQIEQLHQICLNYLDENWNEMSLCNIISIEYGSYGDMIGSSEITRLYLEKGRWYIMLEEQQSHNSKTDSKIISTDKSAIEKIIGVIEKYQWLPMQDLPLSDIQILDGPTDYLQFTFEPFYIFRIDSNQALSDEAVQMWREIKEIIENIIK